MNRAVLVVLGVFAVVLLLAALDGQITGNAFAWNLPRSCEDSDGGDQYEKGITNFKDRTSVSPQSAEDRCVNAGNLLEHYCDGVAHLTETIPCKCEDGACVRY